MGVSRRRLVQSIVTAPLLVGTAPLARSQNRAQVLVIGAGLSGLNAAVLLQQEGVDVRVIEGRQRVGGRILTLRDVPGKPETGGTGASPAYARWIDAARTYNVPLADMTPILPYLFKRELVLGDEVIPTAAWPDHPRNPFPKDARDQLPWQFVSRIIREGNPLDSLDDWLDPANAHLDIALHDWLTARGLSDPMIELGYNTNSSFGSSAHAVSALNVFGNNTLSTLQREFVASSGVAGYRISEGIQSIPEAMSATLKHEVEFGRDVVGLRSNGSGAEVHCADGSVYRADRVVCSIPAAVLRRVRMDPFWKPLQAKLIRTLAYQRLNVAHIVPTEPFWEADGINPNMFTDGPAGMVLAQRRGSSPAEVTSFSCWISGRWADWLDQLGPAAGAAVVAHLESIRPAARGKLKVATLKSWSSDPFAAGTWAVWGPGQISELANAVAQPHGRVHFCGEHTAVTTRGMEGALESGERVALEVLDALG